MLDLATLYIVSSRLSKTILHKNEDCRLQNLVTHEQLKFNAITACALWTGTSSPFSLFFINTFKPMFGRMSSLYILI